MRLNLLSLSAFGVLILSVVLIVRYSGSKAPVAEKNYHLPLHADSVVRKSPSLGPHAAAKNEADAVAQQQSEEGHAQLATEPPTISPPANLPMGIRLADEVQLPAVILAIAAEERNPQFKRPPPVAAAMHAIVDTFYQDLAEAAHQAGGEPSPGEDDTVVIMPGPAVDRARARANETYRALFGDDAFNQMTINAALEARLPLASDSK